MVFHIFMTVFHVGGCGKHGKPAFFHLLFIQFSSKRKHNLKHLVHYRGILDTVNKTTNRRRDRTMSTNRRNTWFSFLYRTRIKVYKNQTMIINLSLLFSLLALSTAPWLAVAGLIIALALGYRFSIEKNAPQFSGDFDEVVRDAAQNVKNTIDGKQE